MKIKHIDISHKSGSDDRINRSYAVLDRLLVTLNEKELPDELIEWINGQVSRACDLEGSAKVVTKQIRHIQHKIIRKVLKQSKLVVKNHYRNLWIQLGLVLFGVPIGVLLGYTLGNMGFIGLGLPIGLGLGAGLGVYLDEKANQGGRQLDFEE